MNGTRRQHTAKTHGAVRHFALVRRKTQIPGARGSCRSHHCNPVKKSLEIELISKNAEVTPSTPNCDTSATSSARFHGRRREVHPVSVRLSARQRRYWRCCRMDDRCRIRFVKYGCFRHAGKETSSAAAWRSAMCINDGFSAVELVENGFEGFVGKPLVPPVAQ